ncbi:MULTISPECIES: transketolase family protein [Agrobacterium]|uniref:transketolase family protein n=1 Tax=Agrobacterium TaxID=357 RepID=UPI0022FFCEC3|nr:MULTISPECIES: transketolase C-terminal domain-containing protein [Agrobacterium]MBM7322167.1 transketolase [Agrobacterium sp. S2]MDA5639570.1 transketolase C-terminal domain-containing protein [Agrobacterium sp. ST15.13.013]MDA6999535.1 transketolase C-terminal domain-containing protein [Agrobacterium salinitolerans]
MSTVNLRPNSPNSWHYRELNMKNPGLDHLSNGLISLVETGHDIVAGSADLQYSNGLNRFAARFPDRYFSFGISEQNMVSAAAGIATTGTMPYVATFASFLGLLTCEQIRMDVAYCALPVRLIGHHTGISMGFYGTSHHATEDIGTMRSIADLTIVSPADGPQFEAAIRASADHDRPIYFRTGRGREPDLYDPKSHFIFGKAIEHAAGEELTIIACGLPVHPSVQVARKLKAEGRSIGVIDMATVKPIDRDAILAAAARSKVILTIEEHNILGGLGAAVAEVLAEDGSPARLVRHGIRDEYALIAPPTHLYAHYRLDQAGIETVVREIIR